MAKVWVSTLKSKASAWGVPPEEENALTSATAEGDQILQAARSADRTPIITTECQRLFGKMTEKMRFIKDRYFKKPPLQDEDFTALLLNPPNPVRTRRGIPKAQMTAQIGRSGAAMLILIYKYAEGTEGLADPHTDIRRQVRYGLLPPPGTARIGKELDKIPEEPEELPIVFATKRRKDILNFDPADSGKTAFFAIRLENGNGEYGPWCPMFHAIIP
jgi:hypothetical protein